MPSGRFPSERNMPDGSKRDGMCAAVCSMPMVTPLTPDTAEAMRVQVIHLSPTVETSMRTTEGGTKAFENRSCIPEDANDTCAYWQALKTAIYKACTDSIGYTTYQHQDWFDENNVEIQVLLHRKITAFCAWQNNPFCQQKQDAYHQVKAEAQRKSMILRTGRANHPESYHPESFHQCLSKPGTLP